MLKLLAILISFLALTGCTPKFFNETQQGNMYLRNQKVYFQRTYNNPVSFSAAEEGMLSYNTPFGGFQAKMLEDNKLNGVMINYQLDWQTGEKKPFKVPAVYKNPINASFEIEKKQGNYTVTVNNIWIAAPSKGKQKNMVIESLVAKKDRCCFIKSKRNLKILELMDRNFSRIFQTQTYGGDLRF